ncbi:MAG: CDP-alcohol phosphatidyltransferase family protein [Deltaproteobacteria bacterium]|nr:CDP-alcohol phosphatidyltransferase family protein [Deltaproteobacteria bacterium]MBW1819004.1 CDP-alcohol phosphatidyltransferase family protein [Deltaproteobacteria bacterium]
MLSNLKPRIHKLLQPIARASVGLGIKPNHVSMVGFFFAIVSSLFILRGVFSWGAFFLLLNGFFDLLDGLIAKTAPKHDSLFGGFLDSVLDRYSEFVVFVSLGVAGVNWPLVFAAMAGAFMVSYTRSRAEKFMKKCDVGVGGRPERLILLVLGLWSGYLVHAVIMIAILSHGTAFHRIAFTHGYCRKKGTR